MTSDKDDEQLPDENVQCIICMQPIPADELQQHELSCESYKSMESTSKSDRIAEVLLNNGLFVTERGQRMAYASRLAAEFRVQDVTTVCDVIRKNCGEQYYHGRMVNLFKDFALMRQTLADLLTFKEKAKERKAAVQSDLAGYHKMLERSHSLKAEDDKDRALKARGLQVDGRSKAFIAEELECSEAEVDGFLELAEQMRLSEIAMRAELRQSAANKRTIRNHQPVGMKDLLKGALERNKMTRSHLRLLTDDPE